MCHSCLYQMFLRVDMFGFINRAPSQVSHAMRISLKHTQRTAVYLSCMVWHLHSLRQYSTLHRLHRSYTPVFQSAALPAAASPNPAAAPPKWLGLSCTRCLTRTVAQQQQHRRISGLLPVPATEKCDCCCRTAELIYLDCICIFGCCCRR